MKLDTVGSTARLARDLPENALFNFFPHFGPVEHSLSRDVTFGGGGLLKYGPI